MPSPAMPTISTAFLARNPRKSPAMVAIRKLNWRLVRLYQATGEKRYLSLAKFFVEERGAQDPHYYDVEAVARGDDPQKFWARDL